jgi:hypothetical protein
MWRSYGLMFHHNRIVINWDTHATETKYKGNGYFCQKCNLMTAHPRNHAEEHALMYVMALKEQEKKVKAKEALKRVQVQCKGYLRGGKGPRCTRMTYDPSGYCAQHNPDTPVKARKKGHHTHPSAKRFSPEVMREHLEEIIKFNPQIAEKYGEHGDVSELLYAFDVWGIDPNVSEEENLRTFFESLRSGSLGGGIGGGAIDPELRINVQSPWDKSAFFLQSLKDSAILRLRE